MIRLYQNKLWSRLFFLFISSFGLVYLVIYVHNYKEYSSKNLKIEKTTIKCINKVCVEYSGIINCIDISDSYIFKISFNKNFNVSRSNEVYSIDLQSLGKKCME